MYVLSQTKKKCTTLNYEKAVLPSLMDSRFFPFSVFFRSKAPALQLPSSPIFPSLRIKGRSVVSSPSSSVEIRIQEQRSREAKKAVDKPFMSQVATPSSFLQVDEPWLGVARILGSAELGLTVKKLVQLMVLTPMILKMKLQVEVCLREERGVYELQAVWMPVKDYNHGEFL